MRVFMVFTTILLFLVPPVSWAGSGTTSGVSNLMNPALSVNGLFRADYSREDKSVAGRGVGIQEVELQFTSIVDPFWKANVIVGFEPDEADRSAFELGVEEANIMGRFLPLGLGLRLGKAFVPFGKHSPLHTHQFPHLTCL